MPITPAQAAAGIARQQARIATRLEWFGERVAANINIGMGARLALAAQLLRDKTVVNISRPVRKFKGPRSGRVRADDSDRSKPGEFPKAETTTLKRSVFFERRGPLLYIIGTPLDYGLRLEIRMNRSFLRRTHDEFRPTFWRIMRSGPRLPGQDLPG